MSLVSSFHQLINELKSDIECAKEWLLPEREIKSSEIKNCIDELDDIVKALNSISAEPKPDWIDKKRLLLCSLTNMIENECDMHFKTVTVPVDILKTIRSVLSE